MSRAAQRGQLCGELFTSVEQRQQQQQQLVPHPSLPQTAADVFMGRRCFPRSLTVLWHSTAAALLLPRPPSPSSPPPPAAAAQLFLRFARLGERIVPICRASLLLPRPERGLLQSKSCSRLRFSSRLMPSCFSIGRHNNWFPYLCGPQLLSKQQEDWVGAGQGQGQEEGQELGQLVSWCSLPEPVAVTVNPATARPGLAQTHSLCLGCCCCCCGRASRQLLSPTKGIMTTIRGYPLSPLPSSLDLATISGMKEKDAKAIIDSSRN